MTNVTALHTRGFHNPQALIKAISRGEMVVLLDDEDRENEGDLVMAAQYVTPEHLNFMLQYARGLLCLTITPEQAERLGLKLMVEENTSPFHTNFTVSIEAAEGVTTGISAFDRSKTISVAIQPDATAKDITMPGHVFPIVAKPNGILERPGHTEASVDLARLAGLIPAGIVIEILNEEGGMARRDELIEFAQTHRLKIGTIADLIKYRATTEQREFA